jgi:hypothetical protein
VIRIVAYLVAHVVVWSLLLLAACSNPRPPLAYTDDPPAEPDTALALQKRLQRSIDSLEQTPRGCSRDSLGNLSCPDIRPRLP